MAKFRFEDLEIWKDAISIADRLFDIADTLEAKRKYRFAEQLRAAALSVSNNIAEGSASNSSKVFIQFLDIAKRSAFENANITIMLLRRHMIASETCETLKERIDHLCRKISNFQKSLNRI